MTDSLAASWKGKQVALTGRLASMDRPTVHRLIARLGGTVSGRVTRHTSTLIIGSDGWPLKRSGRPTKNLRRAATLKRTGCPLEILSEAAFLQRIGVSESDDALHRLYTVEQISEMVQVSGLRIRRWIAAGLVEPQETRNGVALFSFRQVASIRDLWRLIAGGCTVDVVMRNLRRLSRIVPEDRDVIAEVRRVGRTFVTRTGEGGLVDADGQHLFCFDESPDRGHLAWVDCIDAQRDPDAAFAFAVELESASAEQAIEAYQAWLDRFGLDASALFNLANLLAATGDVKKSIQCYRRAIAADAGNARLWNNFGLALAQDGKLQDAVDALERAIEHDPHYGDAYFNAADLLEEQGQLAKASLLWKQYLRFDGDSEHAQHARERCGAGVISTADDS